MNPDELRHLLESSRPVAPLPPRARDAVVRYRFDLRGGESRVLRLGEGLLTLEENGNPADCVVVCDPDDFPKLLGGEKNLLTAWARGEVEFRGTPETAKLLHTYLRHLKGAERKRAV